RVVDTEDPVADAGPDITVSLGEAAVMDGSGSSDDKGISSFEWKVENGAETVFLRGESISFIFSAPGTYNVTLTVSDQAGKQDTDQLQVTVR
ncbi:MAG: PKD domain-containing protein, partial [Thermoplasmata archaeon]